MVPFKETIHSKEELVEACKKGFEDYSNKRISKNDFCMFFGFTHGEAITSFYGSNYEQLLVDGGFNTGSGAYFAGGVNAWKNLRDGKYTFPPIIFNHSKPLTIKTLTQQIIYYGAPGTGKSFTIDSLTKNASVIRTTFHPDSDYSTFVGAYKPTMEDVETRIVPVVVNNGISLDQNNGTYKEKRITYNFVKQAFLKAYLSAWRKMSSSAEIMSVTFTIGGDEYTILSVENDKLTQRKQATISKGIVKSTWEKSWNADGNFELPVGPQSGTSVQQAISDYIYHVLNHPQDDFDNGWKDLIEVLRHKSIDVSKTQTYTLSYINEESVAFSAIANNSKDRLRQCYADSSNAKGVEIGITQILKKYNQQTFDEAWDILMKEVKRTSVEDQFLVIEEINRGNCAQIFGDIFQLLDRSENGYSSYPIEADSDVQRAISNAFKNEEKYKLVKDLNVDDAVDNYTSNYGATLSEDIQEGRVMLLPPNLYIWATMNTSDQSLFPIDSAFKRRWEWEYIKITKPQDKNWELEDGTKWWDFLQKINAIIASMTSSADKQLGYFFCKPDKDNNTISYERFVNKVVFYLWNDVFKDYAMDEGKLFKFIPKDNEGKDLVERDLTYPDFYDDEKGEKQDYVIAQFIQHVMEWQKDNQKA